MVPLNNESGLLSGIKLPSPTGNSAVSLVQALRARKTTRDISPASLPLPVLSRLLWAAGGVNRPRGPFGMPGLTAASASNSREIDVYVAMEDGVYLYDALENALEPVVAGDLRTSALTPGQQAAFDVAPVVLIYVVDVHRLTHTSGFQEPGLHDPEVQKAYYYVDTGLIAGNVYLFAAAEDLASWFHNCDREELTRHLGLRPEQRVLFAQSVGYPADNPEQ